ncbi:hypothetical protein [Dysgonomonas sp. 520]|uniref:hypothetical protein n=1 Tax=Dysgonomonas sp. 520 TaxID=2302931 RepID=UPI0013D812C7|nr:hypothetical protein [Dysgonomonas sp. 520]NDW10666.1 hypothetical protein [Dysgonomonas sp. 520]
MKIIFDPEAEEFLYQLVEMLYHKEYFGFYEDAVEYVATLIADINTSLPNKLKKSASKHFSKYGKNLVYTMFKKNDNTQWYVFFNYEDDVYYIRYIGNNHTCAQYLNE